MSTFEQQREGQKRQGWELPRPAGTKQAAVPSPITTRRHYPTPLPDATAGEAVQNLQLIACQVRATSGRQLYEHRREDSTYQIPVGESYKLETKRTTELAMQVAALTDFATHLPVEGTVEGPDGGLVNLVLTAAKTGVIRANAAHCGIAVLLWHPTSRCAATPSPIAGLLLATMTIFTEQGC